MILYSLFNVSLIKCHFTKSPKYAKLPFLQYIYRLLQTFNKKTYVPMCCYVPRVPLYCTVYTPGYPRVPPCTCMYYLSVLPRHPSPLYPCILHPLYPLYPVYLCVLSERTAPLSWSPVPLYFTPPLPPVPRVPVCTIWAYCPAILVPCTPVLYTLVVPSETTVREVDRTNPGNNIILVRFYLHILGVSFFGPLGIFSLDSLQPKVSDAQYY